MAHNMKVFEFPPRAFWRILVRVESRKGATTPFFFPVDSSAKALITCPSTVKLLLIMAPSLNLSPWLPVFPTFSLPAKSIKFSIDSFSVFFCLNS